MPDTPPSAPDPADLPRPRGRARRWLKRAIVALILLPVIALIAVVVLLVTLPRWVSPDRVRREAIAAAEDALQVDVDIAGFDYDLAWGFALKGLRIGPPKGFTRDVVQLAGLELRWKLPWSTDDPLVIERAALVEPHVVIETVNGVRNLDVLFPPSDAGEPPEPPEPSEPLRGPLSPLTVLVRRVAIERAAVELVGGPGPEATVAGITTTLTATITPATLAAQLALTSTGATVRARVPRPGQPDLRVSTALDLGIRARVGARASDGLQLDSASLDLLIGARDLDLFGDPPIPTADVRLDGRLALDARADTMVLDHLALALDRRTLVSFGARVDGVIAAAIDAAVDPGALMTTLGLVRSARMGTVTVTGPGVTLALAPLVPYAKPFAPGLAMSGDARLVIEAVSGRIPELLASRPAQGGVRVELDRVAVKYPGIDVGELTGQLAVRAHGSAPITLEGLVDGRRVRAGTSSLDALRFGLDGAIEQPAYPATGTASVAMTLALTGVKAPGTVVDGVDLGLTLRGRDPLDPARMDPDPVRVGIDVATRGVTLTSSAGKQTIASVKLELDAALDRVVTPALEPIAAKLSGTIGGIDTPQAKVGEVKVALAATLGDPRPQTPIDVRLDGTVDVADVRAPQAKIGKGQWTVRSTVRGVDPTGRDPLPQNAIVDTTLDLPSLTLPSPPITAHARLDAGVDFAKVGQQVRLRLVRARLDDALDLTLTGEVRDALAPQPRLDVAVALAPLDLAKPVIAALVGQPFTGRGIVRFDARAKGRWTGADDLIGRLEAPPLSTTATLSLASVSVSMPRAALVLEDATGRVDLELSKARAGTRGALKLASFTSAEQSARQLDADWSLGLDEGVWRAQLGLDAAQLGDATRSVEAASVDVDLAHPPFGDVIVRRFAIRAPGAGLEATIDGRLARGRFGAVLPDLEARVSLDFDRLKSVFGAAVPPSLAACTGGLGFELGAHAPRDTRIDVDGALTFTHFGWSGNGTRLVDASGRIPFAQALLVTAPSERLLVPGTAKEGVLAEGGLGLRRSLEDLGDALARRSKLVLEGTDVLLISPRTADYESLRPYYRARSSAKLTMGELAYQHYRLTAVSMDVAYRDGVFRIDRFATGLWGGSIFGEMAFQIAGEDHLRLRLRGTMTDLNLDVPVAAAQGRPPVMGSDARPYQVAGNLDLRVDLLERSLDGYFDFTKMGSEALVGLIDGMDPARKSASLQQTRDMMVNQTGTLLMSTGLRLQGTVMTIRNNLLYLDYTWAYVPFAFDKAYIADWWHPLLYPLLMVPRLTVGNVVRASARSNVQGYSLSNYLEAPWVKNLNDSIFGGALRGRLVLEDADAVARGEAP